MLSWVVENGVIRELRYGDCNFIYPWGIETADSLGFFSLEQEIGYRHIREEERYSINGMASITSAIVRMPEGHWKLLLTDCIESSQVVYRTAELISLDDTVLMDFVMRFRFRKEYFHSAEIAGRTLEHRASDVYNQYPVRNARLNGHNFSVCIEIEESQSGSAMTPMLYLRDHADEWIVHARMIPVQYHKEVIKICNSWAGTRPIPRRVSRTLLTVPGLRSFLWYRNERKPYPRVIRRMFNPNAFAMAFLPKGESLFWKVRVVIS